MSLALFFGAGFSKWAADLPVANQLFDFAIEPWKRERRKLALVKSLKDQWDQAHPDGLVEEFMAHSLSLSEQERSAVLWYVTRRLSEPFMHEYVFQGRRRHVLSMDDRRLDERQEILRVRRFLHTHCPADWSGIFTTNYDLLIEYALGSRKFNYGIPGQQITGYRTRRNYRSMTESFELRGRTPLAKLHGSISWDVRGIFADGRCGLKGNALIVPPTPDKVLPERLQSQHRLARDILSKATNLLVFGFAFNPYDAGVLELLESGGANLTKVLLIDIDPKIDRAQAIWPQASVLPCLPPPDGNQTFKQWLS